MAEELLVMKDIVKSYESGGEEQVVLDHVNFSVQEGEFVSILGPSGSGKSTMMNIIGCLDVPTSGEYFLNGREIENLDEVTLAKIRNREIGCIFQSFQLLPRSTICENVELPLMYAKVHAKERRERAVEILTRMGLGEKIDYYPNQLSGGQQQRVAICRAVITQPSILLADEPTGALDQKTGKQVMELFKELNDEGRTIIMITHDANIAKHAHRIVKILDGKLSEGALEDA